MKKYLLLIMIGTVCFQSCKKKIYGCMDATAINYSDVATEESNSCIYEDVYSSTVDNVTWTFNDPSYEAHLTWTMIDQDIIDNGALNVFIKIGNNSNWSPVPLTFYQSGSYSTTIEVGFRVGAVDLFWTDSDLTQPATPPTNISVKLVIST